MQLLEQYEAQSSKSPAMASLEKMESADREERRAKLQAQYDAEAAELSALSGSNYDNFMSGVGSGMMNVVRGAGNILGLVDDEEIAKAKAIDAELSDSGYGSAGQFTGEMAALAPLGVVGKGAQVAHTAVKGAGVLPTALRVMTAPYSSAALEGAGAGAVLANPNERGEGAALAASTGFVLNRALAGLSRIGKDGLGKVSQSARDLMDLVESKTGKRPFIPVPMAIDEGAGSVTARTGAFMDAVSLLPSARKNMEKQVRGLQDDLYETNIRQTFGGNKANVASDTLRRTGGDMQMALEYGKNAGKGTFTPTQKILDTAARGVPRGRYTPKHLLRASERSVGGDIAHAPLRDTALKMDDVLSRNIGTSNVASRDMYHAVAGLVGSVVDKFPGLGPMLSSKSLQNFLIGNTRAQVALQRAMATGSGQQVRRVISDIRRTISAQPAISDESGDFNSVGEQIRDFSSMAANSLRGLQ